MGYRQVVRQWILIPSCAGSNPATLANIDDPFTDHLWRHSQVVRQRSAKPLCPGSNPGVASRFDSLNLLHSPVQRVFLYSLCACEETVRIFSDELSARNEIQARKYSMNVFPGQIIKQSDCDNACPPPFRRLKSTSGFFRTVKPEN